MWTLLLFLPNRDHSPHEEEEERETEEEGLRDSSSHNTHQVLIASRLLKVNVILTFQSLSLIAFCRNLTVTVAVGPHFLLLRLHAVPV